MTISTEVAYRGTFLDHWHARQQDSMDRNIGDRSLILVIVEEDRTNHDDRTRKSGGHGRSGTGGQGGWAGGVAITAYNWMTTMAIDHAFFGIVHHRQISTARQAAGGRMNEGLFSGITGRTCGARVSGKRYHAATKSTNTTNTPHHRKNYLVHSCR